MVLHVHYVDDICVGGTSN